MAYQQQMAELSPSAACIVENRGGITDRSRDRLMMSRQSPQTPQHRSNGYECMMDNDDLQIMDDKFSNDIALNSISSDTNMVSSPSLISSSWSSSTSIICGTQDVQTDMKKSASSTNDINYTKSINSCAAPPITSHLLQDCTKPNDEISPEVSNEDDECFVVSQDNSSMPKPHEKLIEISHKNEYATTPSRRNKRNSTSLADTPNTDRRRSVRIQARELLDPLTPEKKESGALSHQDDFNRDMMMDNIDDDNNDTIISSSSSRRRSIRVLAKTLDSPAPVTVNEKKKKKKQSSQTKKRRYSQSRRNRAPPKKRCTGKKKVTASTIDDRAKLPPPGQLTLRAKKEEDGWVMVSSPEEIGIRQNGQASLTQAMEKVASNVITDNNPKLGKSTAPVESEKKRRGGRTSTSVLESLEEQEVATHSLSASSTDIVPIMENDASISSTTKKPRPKNRRDTFDLSKNRGLISASHVEDAIPHLASVEATMPVMPRAKNRRDTFDLSKNRGLLSASRDATDLNVLIDDNDNEVSPGDNNHDYVTPKAGCTEVNINSFATKQEDQADTYGADTEEYAAVKNNLSNLTATAIKEKMSHLIPQDKMEQVCKYPCVSARIFAAMSIIYADQANFTPLLPFFLSLIDAEIVSLKNKEDNEVCFTHKKVCFSGYDYSSTITEVGAVVGQGGGDLRPSIVALETVLQQALKLPRPAHYFDLAIQCLHCLTLSDDASESCADTMSGHFPKARFTKAFKHYMHELKDIKSYVLSSPQNSDGFAQNNDAHMGVRYRLNDFIGRSVRYHLRELINTLPEKILDFNVDNCEERWGNAVDDRSISSIFNFSLEKVHDLMAMQPELFDYGTQNMPDFFSREISTRVLSMSKDDLKKLDKAVYNSLVMDITEARSFMFGARACKFVFKLLNAPGVEKHIHTTGGWGPVESIASTFYNLNLYEGSENCHFVQLREVQDLIYVSHYYSGKPYAFT